MGVGWACGAAGGSPGVVPGLEAIPSMRNRAIRTARCIARLGGCSYNIPFILFTVYAHRIAATFRPKGRFELPVIVTETRSGRRHLDRLSNRDCSLCSKCQVRIAERVETTERPAAPIRHLRGDLPSTRGGGTDRSSRHPEGVVHSGVKNCLERGHFRCQLREEAIAWDTLFCLIASNEN